MLAIMAGYIGCLFVFAVSVLILAYAWCICSAYYENRRKQNYYRAMDEAKIQLGRSMMQEAYWLAENEEAFKTMHLLGKQLSQNNGYAIDKFREELKTYDPH
jgi:hypothetical protein